MGLEWASSVKHTSSMWGNRLASGSMIYLSWISKLNGGHSLL